MNDAKRNKIITFRVTDEEYTQIKDAALTQNRDPNDWCRHAALSSSHFKLTVNEDVFYTELALLRFLIMNGFNLLFAEGSQAATVWSECMDRADQQGDELFTELMSQRKRG